MVSESLRSLTKNEGMSESLNFLSESLIRSFLGKKWAIRSENWWANSQAWFFAKKLVCPFKKMLCRKDLKLFSFSLTAGSDRLTEFIDTNIFNTKGH